MANCLFGSTVAVLPAIVATHYQEPRNIFSLSPSLKEVVSARDITYLGRLSPAGSENFQHIFYKEELTGQQLFAASELKDCETSRKRRKTLSLGLKVTGAWAWAVDSYPMRCIDTRISAVIFLGMSNQGIYSARLQVKYVRVSV
ncbi:hypothetical protein BDW75DRAFT_68384 [Aspergillus navahoensis]